MKGDVCEALELREGAEGWVRLEKGTVHVGHLVFKESNHREIPLFSFNDVLHKTKL